MHTSVIIVILTVTEEELRVLLIHRSGEPYTGWWALPGGRLLPDESLAEAAARMAAAYSRRHADHGRPRGGQRTAADEPRPSHRTRG